jgi:hypothetical protein
MGVRARAGAILLLDDADALFGRRSEVKNHPRPLREHRGESPPPAYRGLAVLTTNQCQAQIRLFCGASVRASMDLQEDQPSWLSSKSCSASSRGLLTGAWPRTLRPSPEAARHHVSVTGNRRAEG